MKIIHTADWHYRSTAPRCRTSSYKKEMDFKIDWILRQCKKYDAVLTHGGDISDHFTSSNPQNLLYDLIDPIIKTGVEFYAVKGQHDCRYHNLDERGTFYGVLHAAKVFYDPSVRRIILEQKRFNDLYGMSWGQDTPEITNTEAINILLTHFSVYQNKVPFFMEDKALTAKEMLNKYSDFDIILTGDIHEPAVLKENGRLLVNPGSLMRMNKDQYDYKPRVYLIDTETLEVTELYLPIEPAEEVFKQDVIEKDTRNKFHEELKELAQSLKIKKTKPKFKENVDTVMKELKTKEQEQELVHFLMEEVKIIGK